MAERDFEGEARRETERDEASKRWVQARIDAIRKNVTAHDVLRRFGAKLRQSGSDREEQISCPFHGTDRHPSCRIYPETVRGPSHAWCFVCQERWDAIGLWRKFATHETKFTRILGEMERAFGIIPPEAPPIEIEDEEDPELLEMDQLFDVCEKRLRGARESFDMKGFLTLGAVLDRLYYQVEEGRMKPAQAKPVLQKVLDKIGEKVRGGDAAPAQSPDE